MGGFCPFNVRCSVEKKRLGAVCDSREQSGEGCGILRVKRWREGGSKAGIGKWHARDAMICKPIVKAFTLCVCDNKKQAAYRC